MLGLYEEIQRLKYEELKIQAALHGAKIKGPAPVSEGLQPTGDDISQAVPMFKDPSEYDHLSDEEKDTLTDKMMAQHKMWSAGKLKV